MYISTLGHGAQFTWPCTCVVIAGSLGSASGHGNGMAEVAALLAL